ncbi:hypothetical protein CTAYLR_000390 [Chrysophaeum taylorii]|uniref:SET domain-containing protein n=1 Tax=Chrysophaeum taylorii TaxID=2483200 RepID=A0AAD7UFV9_9STRA|nr:hypothetical protein CTAYLR_000390 [Chrysophaeum taylorii]
MRFTLWRRYASDVSAASSGSEEESSESAARARSPPPVVVVKATGAAAAAADKKKASSVSSEAAAAAPSSEPSSEPSSSSSPPEVPTKGGLARGARGLIARVRSMAQSVEEVKDRLFFDASEAAARRGEFEKLCDALEEAGDALEEDDFREFLVLVERVRFSAARVGELWQTCDDLAERIRARCAEYVTRNPRAGFAAYVRVRRVGADGDPALRGQFECVATRAIRRGETAPYPGVVVATLEEQKALLAPLRPVDRTKWSCFSYSFSESSSSSFCTELWPILEAPTTLINDACGPRDRSGVRMAERQNVEYVEVRDGSPNLWRVDVRAIRDIAPGETLLADYGDAYWQNWKEHVHTRAMKRLEQRVDDVFAMKVNEKKKKKAARVRIENRLDAWLRLATSFFNTRDGEEETTAALELPVAKRSKSDRAAAGKKKKSWRDVVGRRVLVDDVKKKRGYSSIQVGVASRVATERASFDPMLQALYEAALSGPALFEAWWTDGQPYPLLSLDPTPIASRDLWARESSFDVHFADGEKARVDRVAPILQPAVWRRMERLPVGAWCRPTLPNHDTSNWGVVVNYTYHHDLFVYHVKMDNDPCLHHFAEPDLEPIIIVRGIHATGKSTWQEATPLSFLTDLGDADDAAGARGGGGA